MCKVKYKLIHRVCVHFVRKVTRSRTVLCKREILYNCEAKSVWQLPNLFKEVRAVPNSGDLEGKGSPGAPMGLRAEDNGHHTEISECAG